MPMSSKDNPLTKKGEPETVIMWHRRGKDYTVFQTPCTGAIDLDQLTELIDEHVRDFVDGEYAVRVAFTVHLDGGPHFNHDYGEGSIQVRLPSAKGG